MDTVRALLAKYPPAVLDRNLYNKSEESAITLAAKKRGFHKTLGVLLDNGGTVPSNRIKTLERYCIDNRFAITARVLGSLSDDVTTGVLRVCDVLCRAAHLYPQSTRR